MSYFWEDIASYGQKEAIILQDESFISYLRFVEISDEIVHYINKGSLVAIECENHPDCIAAYLGCLRKGIVPLLLDAALHSTFKNNLYERYSPAAVWKRGFEKNRFYWHIIKQQKIPVLHQNLALLLSTSGTTGSPRLVRLNKDNLQSNAESIIRYLRITPDDRAITSLPMHYSYGLSVINTHLLAGATLLVTSDSIMERGFWQFVKNASSTSFAGVPTMYEILKRLRFDRMSLPGIRLMTQAGGRLEPATVSLFAQYARQKKFEFIVMYGQTEATARITYLPHESVLSKPESIGIPIPGGELFLRDSNGVVIEIAGQPGELVYRGKNVMMGYADSLADLSRGDDMCGELATGDIAIKDNDGYYTITGRIKRFIKIHGNRINLDEIEKRIQKNSICAFATGYDDMLIIAVNDSTIISDVSELIKNEYHFHHSVVKVAVCESIPLTSSGKVNYPELLNNILLYTSNN